MQLLPRRSLLTSIHIHPNLPRIHAKPPQLYRKLDKTQKNFFNPTNNRHPRPPQPPPNLAEILAQKILKLANTTAPIPATISH